MLPRSAVARVDGRPSRAVAENVSVCGKAVRLPAVARYTLYDIKAGFSQQQIFECRENKWERTSGDDSQCHCTSQEKVSVKPCPDGKTGEIRVKERLVCTSDTTGSWIEGEKISDTCVCVPQVQTAEDACTTGYTGKIVRQRRLSCPQGGWSNWETVKDMCSRGFDPQP